MPKKLKKSRIEEEQDNPTECGYCFEEGKDLIWDGEIAMWVCNECERELQEERDLMKAVDERTTEYFDRERYENDED